MEPCILPHIHIGWSKNPPSHNITENIIKRRGFYNLLIIYLFRINSVQKKKKNLET